MKCISCLREFEGSYVSYGGVVFCDENCLAEFTVKRGLNIDDVESGFKVIE